ncbi:hypothetical protein BC828DRAFT_402522 [Blastocladiella britannica]|nr:hypothetical protein BC828DRAFT_402522 [Blastocladiella britannica]
MTAQQPTPQPMRGSSPPPPSSGSGHNQLGSPRPRFGSLSSLTSMARPRRLAKQPSAATMSSTASTSAQFRRTSGDSLSSNSTVHLVPSPRSSVIAADDAERPLSPGDNAPPSPTGSSGPSRNWRQRIAHSVSRPAAKAAQAMRHAMSSNNLATSTMLDETATSPSSSSSSGVATPGTLTPVPFDSFTSADTAILPPEDDGRVLAAAASAASALAASDEFTTPRPSHATLPIPPLLPPINTSALVGLGMAMSMPQHVSSLPMVIPSPTSPHSAPHVHHQPTRVVATADGPHPPPTAMTTGHMPLPTPTSNPHESELTATTTSMRSLSSTGIRRRHGTSGSGAAAPSTISAIGTTQPHPHHHYHAAGPGSSRSRRHSVSSPEFQQLAEIYGWSLESGRPSMPQVAALGYHSTILPSALALTNHPYQSYPLLQSHPQGPTSPLTMAGAYNLPAEAMLLSPVVSPDTPGLPSESMAAGAAIAAEQAASPTPSDAATTPHASQVGAGTGHRRYNDDVEWWRHIEASYKRRISVASASTGVSRSSPGSSPVITKRPGAPSRGLTRRGAAKRLSKPTQQVAVDNVPAVPAIPAVDLSDLLTISIGSVADGNVLHGMTGGSLVPISGASAHSGGGDGANALLLHTTATAAAAAEPGVQEEQLETQSLAPLSPPATSAATSAVPSTAPSSTSSPLELSRSLGSEYPLQFGMSPDSFTPGSFPVSPGLLMRREKESIALSGTVVARSTTVLDDADDDVALLVKERRRQNRIQQMRTTASASADWGASPSSSPNWDTTRPSSPQLVSSSRPLSTATDIDDAATVTTVSSTRWSQHGTASGAGTDDEDYDDDDRLQAASDMHELERQRFEMSSSIQLGTAGGGGSGTEEHLLWADDVEEATAFIASSPLVTNSSQARQTISPPLALAMHVPAATTGDDSLLAEEEETRDTLAPLPSLLTIATETILAQAPVVVAPAVHEADSPTPSLRAVTDLAAMALPATEATLSEPIPLPDLGFRVPEFETNVDVFAWAGAATTTATPASASDMRALVADTARSSEILAAAASASAARRMSVDGKSTRISTAAGSGGIALAGEDEALVEGQLSATALELVRRLTTGVDYEFMLDFFIVYRLFLDPLHLAKLLVLRIRGAIPWPEDSDQRRVVRMRSFVVLRHWLDNYFEYDFADNKKLRRYMGKALKTMTHMEQLQTTEMDVRMIKKLKHLWISLSDKYTVRDAAAPAVPALPANVVAANQQQQMGELMDAPPVPPPVMQSESIVTPPLTPSRAHIRASLWSTTTGTSHFSTTSADEHMSDSGVVLAGPTLRRRISLSLMIPPPPVPGTDALAPPLSRSLSSTSGQSQLSRGTDGAGSSSNGRVTAGPGSNASSSAGSTPPSYGEDGIASDAYAGMSLVTPSSATPPGTVGGNGGGNSGGGNSGGGGVTRLPQPARSSVPARPAAPPFARTSSSSSLLQLATFHDGDGGDGAAASDVIQPAEDFIDDEEEGHYEDDDDDTTPIGQLSLHRPANELVVIAESPIHAQQGTRSFADPVATLQSSSAPTAAAPASSAGIPNRLSARPSREVLLGASIPHTLHRSRGSISSIASTSNTDGLVRAAVGKLKSMFKASGRSKSPSSMGDAPQVVVRPKPQLQQHPVAPLMVRTDSGVAGGDFGSSAYSSRVASSAVSPSMSGPPSVAPSSSAAVSEIGDALAKVADRLGIVPAANMPESALPSAPRASGKHPPWVMRVRSAEVAQHLSIVDQVTMRQVDWTELLDVAVGRHTFAKRGQSMFTGAVPSTTDAPAESGADDIKRVIDRFNITCQWVASQILVVEEPALRAKVIEKFIKIAIKCEAYRNYCTLMAITLALQAPHIDRLKRTWAKVSTEKKATLAQLIVLTSPFHNFRDLREAMENAITGVPFIGIYLSDLMFNNELPSTVTFQSGSSSSASTRSSSSGSSESGSSDEDEGEDQSIASSSRTRVMGLGKPRRARRTGSSAATSAVTATTATAGANDGEEADTEAGGSSTVRHSRLSDASTLAVASQVRDAKVQRAKYRSLARSISAAKQLSTMRPASPYSNSMLPSHEESISTTSTPSASSAVLQQQPMSRPLSGTSSSSDSPHLHIPLPLSAAASRMTSPISGSPASSSAGSIGAVPTTTLPRTAITPAAAAAAGAQHHLHSHPQTAAAAAAFSAAVTAASAASQAIEDLEADLTTVVNWQKYKTIAKVVKQFKSFLDAPSYASTESWPMRDDVFWHCVLIEREVLPSEELTERSYAYEPSQRRSMAALPTSTSRK